MSWMIYILRIVGFVRRKRAQLPLLGEALVLLVRILVLILILVLFLV